MQKKTSLDLETDPNQRLNRVGDYISFDPDRNLKQNYDMKFTLIILLISALNFSCTKSSSGGSGGTQSPTAYTCNSSPVAKGSRVFGMDILDVPTGGSYNDSLAALKSIGGTFQSLHLYWNQIEGAGSGTTSGTFTDPYGALAAMNAIAVSDGVKLTLRIHPVDLPGKYVPSDLSSTRFNSATLKTRARAMIDYVFTKVNKANVNQVFIGNEIDGYDPGSDTDFWLDYPDFLSDIRTHINTNYSLPVGFVTTLVGVTDSTKTLPPAGAWNSVAVFTAWMSAVDTIGITYYPLTTTFQMKANSGVATDFQNLAAFTSKPIHIEEVGYSSSSTTAGSEYLQSEFFCEVFKAWDTHSTKIQSLAVLRMIDKTRADSESIATTYGVGGNENFIEYIRTLGLKSNTSVSKPAFTLIESELDKRGF